MIKALRRLFRTDPYFGGVILGFTASIPYLIMDYLYTLILKINSIYHYAAILIVSHTDLPLDYLIGSSADLVVGSFLGFLIIAVFERTNYRFLRIKCFGLGVILWILHVSIIPKLWEPKLLSLMDRPTIYMALINHVLWGLLFGIFLNIMLENQD